MKKCVALAAILTALALPVSGCALSEDEQREPELYGQSFDEMEFEWPTAGVTTLLPEPQLKYIPDSDSDGPQKYYGYIDESTDHFFSCQIARVEQKEFAFYLDDIHYFTDFVGNADEFCTPPYYAETDMGLRYIGTNSAGDFLSMLYIKSNMALYIVVSNAK